MPTIGIQRIERKQKPRGDFPAGFLINLAIPTFASALTIIGPGCLTTVFGMGTGVSTTVWSPERRDGRSNPAAPDILVFELEWRRRRPATPFTDRSLCPQSCYDTAFGERSINVAKRSSVSTG